MPITQENTEKIITALDKQFGRGKSRTFDRQDDGGYARIAITVDELSKSQIIAMGNLAQEIVNPCAIKRSGTSLTLFFY